MANSVTSGVAVPVEALAEPAHINWLHVDGPYMTWAGQGHWLTWSERVSLLFRRTTLDEIATKRFRGYGATAWRREARLALSPPTNETEDE